MHALVRKNEIYSGADNKESLFDLSIPKNWNHKLVIFVHGFMGFKDWGAWNLVQELFNSEGFGFLKYNVSHNGGTVNEPIDFPDPESFGKNTYTKELIDLERILNLAKALVEPDTSFYLIGHSRGGGIVLLESLRSDISAIAAWAPISDIGKRFTATDEWKLNGVRYQLNSRTNQELPMSYDIYTDYLANKDRLSIKHYCENSLVPIIVIHGTEDTSVLPEESTQIASWLQTEPVLIENAQHTFNSSHPWTTNELPEALEEACCRTITFFEEH